MKCPSLFVLINVLGMLAATSVQNGKAQSPATVAAEATPASAAESAPLIPPRTGKSETETLFNATSSLGGWDGNPDWWTIKDGAICAKADKVPTTFLISRKNYSDFRLTLWSKVVESTNHAGVAFWGTPAVQERPEGTNFWAYKGVLVIFPGLGLWDYTINKGIPTDPAGKEIAKRVASQNDWIHVEILAQGNRVRAAYNGAQVLDWREPNPDIRHEGPICLQLHGFSKPQEVLYKEVVVETFPKEDRLITVKQ